MRHTQWIIVFLALSNGTTHAVAADREPQCFALIAGINTYQSRTLRALDFAENDATELAARFRKAGYAEVVLIVGSEATKSNLETELARLGKRLQAGDTFVVGLIGHGVHVLQQEDSSFCPYDARLTVDQSGSLISMESLYAGMRTTVAGPRVLLVDACRNGPDLRTGSGIDPAYSVPPPNGLIALHSCSSGQRSRECPTLKHGLFTYALLEALDGKVKCNPKGELLVTQLMKYLPERMEKLRVEHLPQTTKQVPKMVALREGMPKLSLKVAPDAVIVTTLPMPAMPIAPRMGTRESMLNGEIEGPREPKAGDERTIEIGFGIPMVFCWVPEGKCQLGSANAERSYAVRISLKEWERDLIRTEAEELRGVYITTGFWLAKYEVTQRQWWRVMRSDPSYFQTGRGLSANVNTNDRPVESISKADCQAFIAKINEYRRDAQPRKKERLIVKLPHEDAWEYAYRGGKGNGEPFYWGSELNADRANHDGSQPYGTSDQGTYLRHPTDVGSYSKQAPHPWGLCDMSGNVSELCTHSDSSRRTSEILRGGSWAHFGINCRGASRSFVRPTYKANFIGLRLMLTPE